MTFYKKTGTTNKGYDYEDLLTSLLAFKLINDDKVDDFELSSNNIEFGNLEDVVLDVSYKNGSTQKYYVQLKHKSDKRKITKDMLAATKGDFSLHKYFECFKIIKTKSKPKEDFSCFLYTNASFETSNDFSYKFKLQGKEHLNITILKHKFSGVKDLLNTSNNEHVYKFDVSLGNRNQIKEDDLREFDEYKEFFQRLFLYANQKNFNEMKTAASKLFKDTYSCTEHSFKMYTDFVVSWSEREGLKDSLNKEIIKLKIAEILLKPHVTALSASKANQKYNSFREICLQYDVSIVRKMTFNIFSEDHNEKLEEILRIGKKFFTIADKVKTLRELQDDQLTIILWHMNKVPLIVEVDQGKKKMIYQAIRLCQPKIGEKRKFVLVGENIARNEFVKAKIFQNLNDLDPNSRIYRDLVQNFNISLQGRDPVSVETLIDNDEGVRATITTTEIIKIMEGSFQIGEDKEQLPNPYIDQFLSKILIDFKFVQECRNETLPIISCFGKVEKVKSRIVGAKLITIDNFLKEENKKSELFTEPCDKIILLAEDRCTMDQFNQILEKNPTKICCHFRISPSEELEWITSSGAIAELRKYLLTSDYLEESEIFNSITNKINLICAKSGMGKSIMLKYLKNHYPSSYWVVDIKARELSRYLAETHDPHEIFQHILQDQAKRNKYDPFAVQVRETFRKRNRIVFLWDALDELPHFYLQPAMEAIASIVSLGFTNWLTATNYLRPVLEDKFNVFSLTIRELDETQQKLYIKNHLNYKDEELEEIVGKITRVVATTQDAGFLGIPLQINILTELFHQNPDKYKSLTNDTFTLADMIRCFVKEKLYFCYKNKGDCDLNNHFTKKILKEHRTYKVEQYEAIALKTILSEDIFAVLQARFLINPKKIKDDFGVITEMDGSGRGVFLHNIYGEYFVATWLAQNFERVPDFKNFIFEEDYKNVRLIFDMILAKDCPAHLAVLHKNFSALSQYHQELHRKDRAGRNPLQLACSWGEKHPLLTITKDRDEYIIDYTLGDSVKADKADYREALQFLVERCDPYQVDDTLRWNSLDYADKTLSLLPIEMILTTHKVSLDGLRNFSDIASVVFYSVEFKYTKLFELIKHVPYIESKDGNSNLLHMVAMFQRSSFLPKIFKTRKYHQMINVKNCIKQKLMHCGYPVSTSDFTFDVEVVPKEQGYDVLLVTKETPLHLSALVRDYETVKFLVEQEAQVNVKNNADRSPLHYAAAAGSLEIVKFLVTKGGDVNQIDKNNNNVLFPAILKGDFEVVRYLLEEGARIRENKSNINPLDYAVTFNHPAIVELLIKNGTPLKYMQRAFIPAVGMNRKQIVNCLIENGVDVNKPNDLKVTALHLAASKGHLEMVRILIGKNVEVDSEAPQMDFRTPLHYAVIYEHLSVVQLLVKKGASVSKTDSCGLTSLHYSVGNKNIEMITFLLDQFAAKKIDIDVRDLRGNTALQYAVLLGFTEVIQILIERGAKIDVRNKNGWSPLHCAIGGTKANMSHIDCWIFDSSPYKMVEILELLIECGADVNITDHVGATPLHFAAFYGKIAAVKILVEKGAVVDTADNGGITPWQIADKFGYEEIVELLKAR